MDRPRLLRSAVAALVLGLGLALWPEVRHRAGMAAPAVGAAMAAAPVAQDVDSTSVERAETRGEPSEPLPPADARIAATFATLRQRADDGDAHAACRLAVDLLLCRNLPMAQAISAIPKSGDEDNEAAYARKGNLEAANWFAEAKLAEATARQRCADVTPGQIALGPAYLRQAARAGIGDAVFRYADGQAFDPMRMFGMLRDPLFDTWRREAPEIARQGVRDGNPAAVMLLYTAYSGDFSAFGGLIADDPVQAHAYRALWDRLHGRTPHVDPSLPGPQQQEADAIAERMHRQYFGGRVLSREESAALPFAMRPLGNAEPPSCE
jgi:hypothetical protein